MSKIGTGLLIAVSCMCCFLGWRLDVERDEHELTRRDLVAVEKKLEACRGESEYRQIQTVAQSTLGAACLAREQAGLDDAALRAAIMATAPAEPITPAQAQQGVNRETRRAAAEYLNRPVR